MKSKYKFENFQMLKEFIELKGIEQVDLKFIDLLGKLRHVSIPAVHFSEKILREGVGFDGSSVTKFRRVEAGDMCIIPDLSTGFIDEFWEIETLSFLCNIVNADDKKPFQADPRLILKRTTQLINRELNGAKVLISPEIEFYLFNEVGFKNEVNHSFFKLDIEEAIWNSDKIGQKPYYRTPKKEGYHNIPPRDLYFNLRAKMVKSALEIGIPIKYHHHEVGGAGQMELELLFENPVEIGDSIILTKYVIKNIAFRNNLLATFMPKPLFDEAGNGLHLHLYLVDESGNNLFYSKEDSYCNFSDLAYYFIGGILRHGRAITAFSNASVNSYKRLQAGFEAPTKLFFSLGNRNAAIRIPMYATKPQEKRFEFRTPDASGNIYLTISAILLAGLDGVRNKIDPRKINGMGPYDCPLNELDKETRNSIIDIPSSFKEALIELEKDKDFLINDNIFTEALINKWVNIKINKEIIPIQQRTTPMEFELYFDL